MSHSKVLESGGKRKPPNAGKGRKKGVQNKLTTTVKDAVQATFGELQSDKNANLTAWAKANTTDFYKIAAKLIPAAVEGTLTGEVSHKITKIVREIVDPKPTNAKGV